MINLHDIPKEKIVRENCTIRGGHFSLYVDTIQVGTVLNWDFNHVPVIDHTSFGDTNRYYSINIPFTGNGIAEWNYTINAV